MKQLLNLLQVKKIIALLLTVAFIHLAIVDRLSESFLSVYVMVIGFYFGQSAVRDVKKGE